MAQEQDPVQKALAESKKVLESANKFQSKAGGPLQKPAADAKPAASPKPATPKKSAGLLGEAESAAKGVAAKKANVDEYNAAQKASGGQEIKPYKDGGKVEKDGPGLLHKGETVLPKDKKKAEKLAVEHLGKRAGIMAAAMKEEEEESPSEEKKESPSKERAEKEGGMEKHGKKMAGKHTKYDRTEIKHHKNGSHTITRHPHASSSMEPGAKMQEPESFAVENDDELMKALQGGGEAEPSMGEGAEK